MRTCVRPWILLLAGVAFAQPAQDGSAKGGIDLFAVDGFGGVILPKDVHIEGERLDISLAPDHVVILGLQLGRRTLRVSVPGFETWQGMVRVTGQHTRVTIGMTVGGIDGPKPICRVMGSITGLRSLLSGNKVAARQATSARLLPLFLNEITDATVDKKGNFIMPDVEPGDYVLVVFQDGRTIAQTTVRVTGDEQKVEVRATMQ